MAKPIQYCKVISLQLNKLIIKKTNFLIKSMYLTQKEMYCEKGSVTADLLTKLTGNVHFS